MGLGTRYALLIRLFVVYSILWVIRWVFEWTPPLGIGYAAEIVAAVCLLFDLANAVDKLKREVTSLKLGAQLLHWHALDWRTRSCRRPTR